MPDPS
jgi:hypothetical protein